MPIRRSASARWEGPGKTGHGTLTTASGVLATTQYSFSTRFENGIGTNPEELIGAAHAGCFSMKLAFVLNAAGFTATSIDTTAVVVLDAGAITTIELTTQVACPGISGETFQNLAADAKENCPVSKLMKAAIVLNATLL